MRRSIAAGLAALALATCDSPNPAAPPPAPAPAPAPVPAPVPAPEPKPLGQPANVRLVDRGQDFIVWEWDPVEAATSYQAHAFPAGMPSEQRPPLVLVAEPTFRADGLEPGSPYTFFVRAVRETDGGLERGPWGQHASGYTVSPPVPLYMGEPGEPRVCTDERERALAYVDWHRGKDDQSLPYNWDGTPFTVNFFDNFPDGADYLAGQLEIVDELADIIEEHIGYPIIQAGDVIPTPGLPDGWNSWGFPGCRQWREPGTVVGAHLDALPEGRVGGTTFAANIACAMLYYWTADGVPPPGYPDWRVFHTGVLHELFHLFGYKHSVSRVPEGIGIVMSSSLWGDLVPRRRYHAVTYEDIDALRCIFPLP